MNPSLMNLLLYGGCLAIGYILAGGKFDFLSKLQAPKPVPEPLPNPVSPAVVPQPIVEAVPHDWKDQHVAVLLKDLLEMRAEVKKPDA